MRMVPCNSKPAAIDMCCTNPTFDIENPVQPVFCIPPKLASLQQWLCNDKCESSVCPAFPLSVSVCVRVSVCQSVSLFLCLCVSVSVSSSRSPLLSGRNICTNLISLEATSVADLEGCKVCVGYDSSVYRRPRCTQLCSELKLEKMLSLRSV